MTERNDRMEEMSEKLFKIKLSEPKSTGDRFKRGLI